MPKEVVSVHKPNANLFFIFKNICLQLIAVNIATGTMEQKINTETVWVIFYFSESYIIVPYKQILVQSQSGLLTDIPDVNVSQTFFARAK